MPLSVRDFDELCRGRVPYAAEETAERNFRFVPKFAFGKEMRVYECPFDERKKHWHIGPGPESPEGGRFRPQRKRARLFKRWKFSSGMLMVKRTTL